MPEAASSPAEWTHERVLALLRLAASDAARHHGTILGAALGKRLRALDRMFRPSVLGDVKLSELLSRFPEIGRVEVDPIRNDVRFVYAEFQNRPGEAPRKPLMDQSDVERLPRLPRDLWIAFVAERAQPRYIDLQGSRVLVEGRDIPQSEIDQQQERYLLVPSIPQDDLREVARQYAASCEEPLQLQLQGAIEGDGWFNRFTELLQGNADEWLQTHRKYVGKRALTWLTEHGLKADRLFPSTRQTGFHAAPSVADASSPASLANPPPLVRENIRRLVSRAIERMSDEELLSLRIPLRYLLE